MELDLRVLNVSKRNACDVVAASSPFQRFFCYIVALSQMTPISIYRSSHRAICKFLSNFPKDCGLWLDLLDIIADSFFDLVDPGNDSNED